MTRTLQHVEAFLQRYGLICAKCSSNMHITLVQNREYMRAVCLARHCEQYGLIGELPNERIKLLAVSEDTQPGAQTIDVEVVDIRSVDQAKIGGTD